MCYTFVCFHTDVRNIINILHEAGFSDDHWEHLGLQLIDHTVLQTIRVNRHGSAALCMIDTISQWLRTDVGASWEKLAEAVAKVGGFGDIIRRKAGIGKTDFKL